MLNEEDHIRIQCLFSGLQLSEALQSANQIDNWIEKEVEYAFDESLGYITSCPTNVGTGLRASVMIHLPGLVLTKRISRIIQVIQKLGLVVRGIYGEGSEALGNIFQVSNQMTLGKSEEDIIADLKSV
ncbi:protein arginine kinase, partial [Escherichia coli]|nr:protein arginine kinase [Escherichia coli]